MQCQTTSSLHQTLNGQTLMLYFKETSWQSSFLPSLARFGFLMRPLWLKMLSTGVEVAGTDNTLSRSGCRMSNDLSAFTAAHRSQSCATATGPTSTVSRYLVAAFLTVTGGAETAADSQRRSYAAKSDERGFFAGSATAVSLVKVALVAIC